MKKFQKIYLGIVFLFAVTAIIFVQFFADQAKAEGSPVDPYVPNSKIVKVLDLGLNNAAADISWLFAIQYFGGRLTPTYDSLDDYLFLSADLDPKFSYPYAFGVLLLPSVGQTDRSFELGEQGIRNSTPDWRIPYYMATTYHMTKNDTENAAKYFDLAAHTVGAPDNIQKVAASYGTRPDLRSQTELIWQGIYDGSTDMVVKERAKDYLTHLALLDFLEEAAKEYKKINNKFPDDTDQLLSSHILRAIPADPFGYQYKFNAETGRAEIKNN